MLISPLKRKQVLQKTNCKCAICGSESNLTCTPFIPSWTRITDDSYESLIPLCNDCFISTRYKFIELGSLRYLPDVYIQMLMRWYMPNANYLYKYVRMYGAYRTNNKLNIDQAVLVLSTYDLFIKDKLDDIIWESID